MNSYEVGTVLGSVQASKWLHRNNTVKSPVDIKNAACQAYKDYASLYKCLEKDDFINGYNDGIETVYKKQLIDVI